VQIDKMSARVRPRKPMEAIDLGFMMVQQWWRKIALSWLVLTLPIFIIINVILIDHEVWAAIIFWWLKPLYDRVPLHIISRALFGNVESLKNILKAIPGLIFPHMIKMLTILRLDPTRSFNLPVWQLEKLTGSARVQRSNVLKKLSGGSAFGLTFLCILMELIFFFSILGLVYMFAPDYYTDAVSTALWPGEANNVWWAGMLINFFIYITYFIVEPFYVAGGFALYINRRTQLEGWDIEIAFRQLAQRIRKPKSYSSVAAVLLACTIGFILSPVEKVNAEPEGLSNAEAKQAIKEIMEKDEFGKEKTVVRWRSKDKDKKKEEKKDKKEEEKTDPKVKKSDKESSNDFGWLSLGLGSIGEVILWVAAFALIVLAIIFYLRWSPVGIQKSQKINKKLPKSLFGLEITPESLPDDVGQAAMDLWNKNDPLVALSLLYRGVLTTLVHRDGINLRGSATEGDCIRIVINHGSKLSAESVAYFRQLTTTWQLAAYAHRLPDTDVMKDLSQRWVQHFGAQS